MSGTDQAATIEEAWRLADQWVRTGTATLQNGESRTLRPIAHMTLVMQMCRMKPPRSTRMGKMDDFVPTVTRITKAG